MAIADSCDLLIVGGGLSGGLIARAFSARRPEVSLRLVEPGERLGGTHIWSFFDADIDDDDRWLVDPLIERRWPDHEVAFPGHARVITQPYNTVTSRRFDAVLRTELGDRVVRGAAQALRPGGVCLADGREIAAAAVIDARGAGDLARLECGRQEFLGQMLTVAGGHGVTRPMIMDATVDQSDGYRFVYLLPFDVDRVFVEDTYYRQGPAMAADVLRSRIDDYAAARGWRVTDVSDEEAGSLPVVTGGTPERYLGDPAIAAAGVRAALFHPLTGYSLPAAVDFAHFLVEREGIGGLAAAAADYARVHWRRGRWYRLLARLMFRAADPPERYRLLERFYRLQPQLIGRFYAGRSTRADMLRVLIGRPPVPIGRAIGALLG